MDDNIEALIAEARDLPKNPPRNVIPIALRLADALERASQPVTEEWEWEYAWELRESDSGALFDRGLPEGTAERAVALGAFEAEEENRASPNEPPLVASLVRRKAGPWEPVEAAREEDR